MSKFQSGLVTQDLNEFIIRGKNALNKREQQRAGNTQTQKKNTMSAQSVKMAKLDKDTESTKHKRIHPEAAKRIVKGRLEKKLNQKQLAGHSKIQMPVAELQKYENGQAIPDNKKLVKLQNFLGVKLMNLEKK